MSSRVYTGLLTLRRGVQVASVPGFTYYDDNKTSVITSQNKRNKIESRKTTH